MAQKNLNFSIDNGDEFFAHETSINFNPNQFILDFKTITPRVDVRDKENAIIVIKHNIVMMDPYHAKKIAELMGGVVAKYEKEFGKIEKSKAMKKMEKKTKTSKKTATVKDTPAYFG